MHTFFEAVVLVVLVVFVFLQSLRATIIPILAVPVSIIGTFVGMHLLGFSVNMLTMFGLILAIGLVVDDAIVVVENVETNMVAKGLSPLEAAKVAMTQIAGALDLDRARAGRRVPAGRVPGRRHRHAVQAVRGHDLDLDGDLRDHGADALARARRDHHQAHHGEKKGFFRWFENGFERLRNGYVGVVARAIQAWPFALLVFGGIIAGIVFMFRVVPSSFVPDEDQGYFFAAIIAPDTANLEVVAKLTERAQKIVSADPAVQDVASVAGYSLIDGQIQNNGAVLFASLKPFEERTDASILSFAVIAAAQRAVRRHQRRLRVRAQPAVDSRHGHHRRLRVLPPEPRRRRRARHRRGGRDVPRQGAAAARARRASPRRTARPRSSCSSTSTAARPRCWASRWPTRSRRCRRSSARRSPASSRSSRASGG